MGEGSGAQGEPAPGALPSQTERRLSQGDSFGRGNSEFGKRKSDDGSDDADRGKTAGRLDQRAQDGRPGAGQVSDEPSRARRAAERLRNPSLASMIPPIPMTGFPASRAISATPMGPLP